jgi:mono/diheme cytochrome c family protein
MRYLLLLVAVVIVSAVALAAWTWQRSETHLTSFPDPPPFTAPIPADAASIAHGRHLALTRGCVSCHSSKDELLDGDPFYDLPWGGHAIAPGLPKLARTHSAAQIERAVRHGIGVDGKALYSMPSFGFVRLTDTDMAALIAYLRSKPVIEKTLPKSNLGPKLRWDIAIGKDAAVPAFTGKIAPLTFQGDPDPAVRRGEYIAMTACTECHGFSLRGDNPFDPPGKGPPDLLIAAAYDKADFVTLMRTGKAAGNREVGLMSIVARKHFAHFTDEDIDDLRAFFAAMSERAAEKP